MKKRLVKILVSAAVLIMGFAMLGTLSFAADNVSTSQTTVTKGTVSATSLNVRQNPGTNYGIITKLSNGTSVTIVGQSGNWYKISINGGNGWVSATYVKNVHQEAAGSTTTVSRSSYSARTAQESEVLAQKIVASAKTYLGKSYKYGATGPNAFDCSGLLYKVYRDNGVNVPRCSSSYMSVGTSVTLSSAKVGDVICFSHNGKTVGHVGIYLGNQTFIHSATSSGVIISSIYDKYWNKRIFAVRSVL